MVIVIIGSSIASKSAIETLLPGIGKEDRIVVATRDRRLFYSRVLLPSYISGELKPEGLMFAPADLLDDERISVVKGEVQKVDTKNKSLGLEGGTTLHYDKLIITSGASPRKAEIDGESLTGVFYLRDLEDAAGIRARAGISRDCIVLGGGLVSIKAATALKKLGLRVKMAVGSSKILSAIADEFVSDRVLDSLAAEGIDVYLNTNVKQINGHNNEIKSVAFEDGSVVNADMVVIGKGVAPNTGFVKGTDILVEKGILVNTKMETTAKDVYAAGDVAQSIDFLGESTGLFTLWPDAALQGRIAAGSILGLDREYTGGISMNSFVVGNTPFIIIGSIREKDTRDCRVFTRVDKRKGVYRKVVMHGDRMTGAVFTGDTGYSGMVFWDIKSGGTIECPERYLTREGLKKIYVSKIG